MAPKSKTGKKAPVTKKTGTSSVTKGLQLSAAQWKAYGAAYSTSAKAGYASLALQQRRAAFSMAVQNVIASRLSAAHKLRKIAAAQHSVARTAAIAAFAARQSYRQSRLAHQNAALQQRVFADYERHVQAASRAQYAYKGEKAYAHAAVMRTMTTVQATSYETAVWARAVKVARAASNSTVRQPASAALKADLANIRANAQAAALAAARATPKGRTAPRPARLHPLGFMHGFGDPGGYDCLPAAVANHLLLDLGVRLDARQYSALVHVCGETGEVEEALFSLSRYTPWDLSAPLLTGYAPVPWNPARVLLVGYDSQEGRHAAVSAGNGNVVSWGEVLPLAETLADGAVVEEAWDLLWVRHRPL